MLTRYVYGQAVDEILARTSASGVTAWYLTDRLGSVRDIVNTSGAVIDHVVYDSYGNILSETSPSNGDRFKFTGMEWDAAIGQYYDHARWLNGAIGRFESSDPAGLSAGDSNLYRYVSNNPVNAVDASGLFQQPPAPPVPPPNPVSPTSYSKNVPDLTLAEIANLKYLQLEDLKALREAYKDMEAVESKVATDAETLAQIYRAKYEVAYQGFMFTANIRVLSWLHAYLGRLLNQEDQRKASELENAAALARQQANRMAKNMAIVANEIVQFVNRRAAAAAAAGAAAAKSGAGSKSKTHMQ